MRKFQSKTYCYSAFWYACIFSNITPAPNLINEDLVQVCLTQTFANMACATRWFFQVLYFCIYLMKKCERYKKSGLLRDSCYDGLLFLFKFCLSHQLKTRSDESKHVLAKTRGLLVAWNVICFRLMKLAYGRRNYYW